MKNLLVIIAGLFGVWYFFLRDKSAKNTINGTNNQISKSPATVKLTGQFYTPGTANFQVIPGLNVLSAEITVRGYQGVILYQKFYSSPLPGNLSVPIPAGNNTLYTQVNSNYSDGTKESVQITSVATAVNPNNNGNTTGNNTSTNGTNQTITTVANEPVNIELSAPYFSPGQATLKLSGGKNVVQVNVKVRGYYGVLLYDKTFENPLPGGFVFDVPDNTLTLNAIWETKFSSGNSIVKESNFIASTPDQPAQPTVKEPVNVVFNNVFSSPGTANLSFAGGKDVAGIGLTVRGYNGTILLNNNYSYPLPTSIPVQVPAGTDQLQITCVTNYKSGGNATTTATQRATTSPVITKEAVKVSGSFIPNTNATLFFSGGKDVKNVLVVVRGYYGTKLLEQTFNAPLPGSFGLFIPANTAELQIVCTTNYLSGGSGTTAATIKATAPVQSQTTTPTTPVIKDISLTDKSAQIVTNVTDATVPQPAPVAVKEPVSVSLNNTFTSPGNANFTLAGGKDVASIDITIRGYQGVVIWQKSFNNPVPPSFSANIPANNPELTVSAITNYKSGGNYARSITVKALAPVVNDPCRLSLASQNQTLYAPGSASFSVDWGSNVSGCIAQVKDSLGNIVLTKLLTSTDKDFAVNTPVGISQLVIALQTTYNNTNIPARLEYKLSVIRSAPALVPNEPVYLTAAGVYYSPGTANFNVLGGKNVQSVQIIIRGYYGKILLEKTLYTPVPTSLSVQVPDGTPQLQCSAVTTYTNGTSDTRSLTLNAGQ